jgi:hypothetical protein
MDDRVEQFSLQACLCGAIQTITNRLESGVEGYADQIMTVLHRVRPLLNWSPLRC